MRPRRAPTPGKEQETVEFLLAATRRVFVRDGLAMTTTRVAEEAGVAVGTVYRYFPAKDALVRAVAEQMAGRATKRLADAVAEAVSRAPQRVGRFLDPGIHRSSHLCRTSLREEVDRADSPDSS